MPDFDKNGSGYLLTLTEDRSEVPRKFDNRYTVGDLESENWISRFLFDAKEYQLRQLHSNYQSHQHSKESIQLRGEQVITLLEFASNQILVSMSNGQLLLVSDWKVVRVFKNNTSDVGISPTINGYFS